MRIRVVVSNIFLAAGIALPMVGSRVADGGFYWKLLWILTISAYIAYATLACIEIFGSFLVNWFKVPLGFILGANIGYFFSDRDWYHAHGFVAYIGLVLVGLAMVLVHVYFTRIKRPSGEAK